MNLTLLETLGLYFMFFLFFVKNKRKPLKEIWNNKDEHNLQFYGFLSWIIILILSFGIVIFFVGGFKIEL